MPMSERLLTLMTHGPAQPVNLNKNEKKERTFKSLKRELVKVSWNPYGGQKNCKTLVKVLDAASKCTKSISRHQAKSSMMIVRRRMSWVLPSRGDFLVALILP
jgi:hypothetical protein